MVATYFPPPNLCECFPSILLPLAAHPNSLMQKKKKNKQTNKISTRRFTSTLTPDSLRFSPSKYDINNHTYKKVPKNYNYTEI